MQMLWEAAPAPQPLLLVLGAMMDKYKLCEAFTIALGACLVCICLSLTGLLVVTVIKVALGTL